MLLGVWVGLSIVFQLSFIKYVGLCGFSLPISLIMIDRMYILCVIIIIKSKVWTITVYYCLGLGHETMVCAVCLSIFLYLFEHVYCWLVGAPRCSNRGVCYFCSIPIGPVHTATSPPAPGDSYLFYHDVAEISDLSQSEALNLVMWRVRVMQPTTLSPWRRGSSWPQFNVQENGSMKCHLKYIAGQD